MQTEFQYLDRGFKDILVLIPGWATDYRIFDTLELEYNYLIPLKLNHSDFSGCLAQILERKKIEKTILFGWSMGGFLALDFCRSFPLKVKELILVGFRKYFDKTALDEIASKIEKSKKAFLYKFYIDVFGSDENSYKWFKKNLMRQYLENNSEMDLVRGLKYLENSSINLQEFTQINKIKIFHSKNDLINPFIQAIDLSDNIPNAKFYVLEDSNHAAFLSKEFKVAFNG